MANKDKDTFVPLPLYINDDIPQEKVEKKEELKEKRGIIEIDISDNSLESLEV